MKLKYYILPSSFAFNFNFRRYSKGVGHPPLPGQEEFGAGIAEEKSMEMRDAAESVDGKDDDGEEAASDGDDGVKKLSEVGTDG